MSTAAATTSTLSRFARATTVAILSTDQDWRDRAREALAEAGLGPAAFAASAANLSVTPGVEAVVVIDVAARFESADEVEVVCDLLPDALVIVVAQDCSNAATRAALRAGATGVVPLDQVDTALAPTVRAVSAGQLCMPRVNREHVQRQPLTAREKQVLALVVMGLTNCEIATKLFLAESTVKSHLSSAFQKLGVRSRNEAAAMILDPGSGIGPGILTIPTENGKPPADSRS